MRLVWTPRALADLDRPHRFLAERDRDAARRAVRAIRDGMRLIEAHPETGRPAEGMDPEFRGLGSPSGAADSSRFTAWLGRASWCSPFGTGGNSGTDATALP
jgi:plasmid stabilization system protein ParE